MAGLTRVVDADLKRLLRALHQGHLPNPISRSGLITAAFGHCEEHLSPLIGLDPRAAQALVAAVVAERSEQRSGKTALAVSGPGVAGTLSQDTAARVQELIAKASTSVHLLGVCLERDAGVLRLVEAIAEPRGVQVTLVADSPDALEGLQAPEGWQLYRPREIRLAARAVLVDRSSALVISDSLSGREQEGALHLGALIEDPAFVASLLEELERLTRSGHFVPV